MPLSPETHQAVVVGLILASLIAFLTDRVRYDVVAIVVVLVLALTGTLEVEEAFAGFSSPAVVLVASMYAFSAAVGKNGIAEMLSERMLGNTAVGERWLIAARGAALGGALLGALDGGDRGHHDPGAGHASRGARPCRSRAC